MREEPDGANHYGPSYWTRTFHRTCEVGSGVRRRKVKGDTNGCGTGATRTSANSEQAKFAEFHTSKHFGE
jgi:hypothetical protein